MRTIIMTKGIPASGKSTWTKEEMRRSPKRFKRVNKDLLRAMLDGEAWSPAQERFMLDIRDYAVQRSLLRDFDVIVDDTNFSDKHWDSMCRIAKRVGDVMVVEKYFDVDLNEAIRRNEGRPESERVPEQIIRDMHRKHVKGKHIECRTQYYPIEPYSAPVDIPGLPKAIIVDIDGTLALSRGIRNPYDGSRLMEDVPFAHVVTLVKLLMDAGHALIFMSGREDKWRTGTCQWLSDVAGLPSDGPFFMRVTGDSRPDTTVKRELYEANVAGKYDVRYVVDDRPSVCANWRDLNLVVLQLDDRPF
jgi:predicted kinase